MFRNLYYILISGRVNTSIVPAIIVFIILFSHNTTFFLSLSYGLIYLLVTMYGFIINDILDYKKDKLANRNKPISQDKLSKKTALIYLFSILCIIFVIEYILGTQKSLIIISFTILLLTLYSFLSKNIPLFKGVVTGVLTITPLYYANSILTLNYNLWIYGFILFYVFSRELYLDAQDYNGDKLSKLKTIPYYLGVEKSKIIGLFLMSCSSISIIAFGIISYPFSLLINIVSIFALIIIFLAVYTSFYNEEKSIFLTKLNMIFLIIPLFGVSI